MKKVFKLEPIPTVNMHYGGKAIQKKYGLFPELPNIGEMYNVIAIKDHLDNIVIGPNIPLSEFYDKNRDFFGDCKSEIFPVRMMMCCINGKGSLHLHPNNEYGMAHDGIWGKIEAGVTRIDGEDYYYVGHRAKTKEEFIQMCEEGRWEELFIERKMQGGDFYLFDYGQIHGDSRDYAGDPDGHISTNWCTNGDLSYRVWDHDRPADPKRPLQKQKVYDCIKVPDEEFYCTRPEAEHINGCDVKKYYSKPGVFEAYDVIVKEQGVFELKEFMCLVCFDGEGEVAGQPMKGGETLMVPADFGPVEIKGNISLAVISYKD